MQRIWRVGVLNKPTVCGRLVTRTYSHSLRAFSLNSRDQAFSLLGLKSFTDSEVRRSFARLQEPASTSSKEGSHSVSDHEPKEKPKEEVIDIEKGIQRLAEAEKGLQLDSKSIAKVTALFVEPKESRVLNLTQYKNKVVILGEKLDPRVWNIGLSFLLTGTSVGIIIPCMPLLVSQLSIPASEFGLVISAFGLSKLIGNIPSGYFVEKYGRKPSMVVGLGMCGVGLGALGLALLPGFGTPWLIACRFISGLGVSGFVAGGYMFMSDISTPLNRTRTIAPVMASFSAGAALGPAAGGFLIDEIGISATYATVGGMHFLLAALNALLLNETKAVSLAPALGPGAATNSSSTSSSTSTSTSGSSSSKSSNNIAAGSVPPPAPESTMKGVTTAFKAAFASWKLLLNDPNRQIRHTVTMNGLVWFTLAGTQMTLLPLMLVGPLHMSAAEIGGSFAFMSMVSFLFSTPVAYFADKYGKVPAMLGGCGLLSGAMVALPQAVNPATIELLSVPAVTDALGLPLYTPALLAVLLPFAMGNTALNATPTALMADLTDQPSRAQGLSLLRTAGDLGLLLGASFAGALAQWASLETALMTNGGLTAAALTWFAIKSRNARKSQPQSS